MFGRVHSPLLTSHKWRKLVFSGVTFVLFPFCLSDFVEAAALPSIFLRYPCAPTATRGYLTNSSVCVLFCFDFSFSEYFCTLAVFFLYEESSYVFSPFRMMFFSPCDHGLLYVWYLTPAFDVWSSHIARVMINGVRWLILLVVS